MTTAKPVLITGCSSGIGLCAAITLKDKGFQVFPTARKPEDIEKLTQLGFDPITLDMNSPESIDKASQYLLEQTDGKIFGLINNAGFVQPGNLIDISRDTLRSQFETNVFGLHQLTQTLLPYMIQQQQGRIIHVSSVLGFVARTHLGAYNASKYAVEGLADTLRLELHPYKDIHVSLVEPGPIKSHLFQNAITTVKQRHNHQPTTADQDLIDTMKKDSTENPFTLPPEAVATCFYHALTKPQPKIRYRITTICKAAAIGKRLLSSKMLDRLLLKSDTHT
jgi:short-subunit dehydrogenase